MTSRSTTGAPVARRTLFGLAAGAAAAGVAAPGPARAAGQWPTGPVRYINLFPPGGSTDVLSRIYCDALSRLAGQQFVVEAKTGAGGTVGQAAIAQAAPDGTTIGLGSVASLAIAPTMFSDLPYNADRDFTYISGIWQLPNVLVVNNDFPARTVPELIAEVRRHPGRYVYGSSGNGTSPHLSMEMLKQRAGLNILHVPYRGSAPATIDLLAGRTQMMFDNIATAVAAAREGKVRILAVTSREPNPAAPEVPPLSRFVEEFEITSWGGVVAPAGVPAEMPPALHALTQRALADATLKRLFADLGATPWVATGAAFRGFRAEQQRLFAGLIAAAGARRDG